MADLLIRNVDDETIRRIDAEAERQGLSRAEYLRREIGHLGRTSSRPATREDLDRSLSLLEDLGDDEVMENAWR